MKLLAFDTATDACAVAVWMDGDVCERLEIGQRHAERLLVLIDDVLAEAGTTLQRLDGIAFGRGPGSFTGLRIGAGVAQGLAFAAGLPVVPVSSLAVLAQGAAESRVLAAFDARMQQVYWGAYVRGDARIMELSGDEVVTDPSSVPLPEGTDWAGAGSGWDQYAGLLQARLGDRLRLWHAGRRPQPRHVAELGAAGMRAGRAVAPEQGLPVYIRDDVAAKTTSSR